MGWKPVHMTNFSLSVEVLLLNLLVFAGVILVLYGTSIRNRWGINVNAVHCPRCNTLAPRGKIRIPTTLQEFMWGGWTCTSCGTRMDKWGTDLTNPSDLRH
jgi:hypothetical protein